MESEAVTVCDLLKSVVTVGMSPQLLVIGVGGVNHKKQQKTIKFIIIQA